MDRTRIAGIVAAAGAAAGALFCAKQLVAPSEVTLANGVVYGLFHVAAIVGLVGLAAQGAAGPRWPGRAGIVAAIGTFVLLVVAELADPIDRAVALPLFEIAPLLMGVALIVIGVAVLRHGRWAGWRRAAHLVSGIYLLVLFLPAAIALGDGPGFWVALVGWQLTLLAVGVAVATEARTARAVPATQTV